MSDNVTAFPVARTNPVEAFSALRSHLGSRILGQDDLVDRLLIAVLADGHLLVEGAPGLAKTKAIRALSAAVEGDYHRIQFTPDLLPADLTGTDVYRPEDGSFRFQRGPIFHNLVLADEINRAPAKVQSALLEAMAERQVTVGRHTYGLPELFLVMATQNPIEQEGTYPLPEAQLDRFLLHVRIGYPAAGTERKILQLVLATREPGLYDHSLKNAVRCGASPRGTIALDRCARAHAWMRGAEFVAPEDIHAVVNDVLRHRVLLTFEAEADGMTPDDLIDVLIARLPLP
jgi:MoxR-like ATPase